MLTIIFGIVVAIGVLVLMGFLSGWEDSSPPCAIAAVILVVAIIVAFCPVNGYEDEATLVREIELVALSNDVSSEGRGLLFVSVSANNVYSYKYEVDNPYGSDGKSFETKTVSENVIETESSQCQKAVLRVYEREAKTNIWTFCWVKQVEYEFYVPEGTIDREVTLK